ncbi:MAG: hypothetical protein SCALA702_20650 [Melioribacteraceae bacterium]|nr:MAG: hypothetical protein SCALA702_20650 [Melioribacteraceae bacterium]
MIVLPGTDQQLTFFKKNENPDGKIILIVGAGAEQIAVDLFESGADVSVIVEDYDSLMNYRLLLGQEERIKIKLMDFTVTDYDDKTFDYVYAQASISDERRKFIIKELKRILKDDGKLCIGEMALLEEEYPEVIGDIIERAGIDPLLSKDIISYYESKNLLIEQNKNASDSLAEFYNLARLKLNESLGDLTEQELSYYKKLIKMIKHESNVFLKYGGDKYLGFYSLIMRKKN